MKYLRPVTVLAYEFSCERELVAATKTTGAIVCKQVMHVHDAEVRETRANPRARHEYICPACKASHALSDVIAQIPKDKQ